MNKLNREIDYIIDNIKTPDKKPLPLDFRLFAHLIYEKREKYRRILGLKPLHRDDKIIELNLFSQTDYFNRNKKRDSGDSYSKHFRETCLIEVDDMSMTGRDSHLLGYNHDHKEHFPDQDFDLSFQSQLSEKTGPEFDQIMTKLHHGIEGVTKIKTKQKQTKEEEEMTYKKMLEYSCDFGPKVIVAKLADRTQNSGDFIGLTDEKGRQKRERTSRQNVKIYIPTAHTYELEIIESKLLDTTFDCLNPELLRDFNALSRKKLQQTLLPYQDTIKHDFERFKQKYGISEIFFIPHSIAKYYDATKHSSEFETLRLPDLEIEEKIDPMFETFILINNFKKINKIIGKTIELLGEGQHLNTHIEEAPNNGGYLLQLFNPTLGGRLHIRINSILQEIKRKRGRLADFPDHNPKAIMTRTKEFLARLEEEKGSKSIYEIADQNLFKPTIKIYSINNKPKILPKGSTPLDYLGTIINGEIKNPVQVNGAMIYDNIYGKNGRFISLFEKIPDGVMINITNCPDHKKNKVDPSWIYCCESSETKHLLMKHLGKKDNLTLGYAFIKKISDLFNFKTSNELLEILKKNDDSLSIKNDQEIIRKIGCGEKDVLRVLAKKFKNPIWYISLELPNIPHALETFNANLGSANIEDHILSRGEGDLGKVIENLKISIPAGEISTYEFFRNIIKTSNEGINILSLKNTPSAVFEQEQGMSSSERKNTRILPFKQSLQTTSNYIKGLYRKFIL